MWPFDRKKQQQQKKKKRQIIIWSSIAGGVAIVGTGATVLGLILSKPKNTNITMFTDLKPGDNLINKYFLMPKEGWNTKNQNLLINSVSINLLTFGQGISERSSMNATLTYDISNDVPYRAGSSNFEALNFKSQGFDDVTNTNTIAKTLISSSKMTWGNKQFGDLSLNIYENYYYLPLNFQDIDLIIAKVDFNSTPTSSNEFNGFIKKCGFIDKID